MPITVTEDEGEGGGYALVDLGALASTPLPRLSVRRQEAEPRHLGPDGWQPEVAWLTPLSAESIGGRTVVRFGPAVVDRIPDEIAVEIGEEGGRSFGTVRWPYITPAPQGLGITIAPTAKPPPNLEAVSPNPETAAGSGEVPAENAGPPEPAPLVPEVAKPPVRPVTPPPQRLAPPRKGGRAMAAVLTMLVLAGVGGGAWLYRDRLPWLASQTAGQPLPRPQTELAELERRFAALLERRARAPDLLALGHEAVGSGQGRIAFRAFEEADPANSEEAAWELARFYDPRVTTGPLRDTATPNPASTAYYHALWRARSARHAEELRKVCELGLEGPGRDRLEVFCRP